MKKFFFSLALLASALCVEAQEFPFRNENLTTEERVEDLLSRLTLDEKIDLLRATSPANERLGFPKYYHGNEALHGIVRPGKFTVFPQAIGLASMWNPVLLQKISGTISDEARARWNELEQGKKQTAQFSDLLTFWSPTVNMARDPRWGRTPETYGEDPFLSGEMGAAFVKGLQGDNPKYLKAVSTPKHFTANNEEHNRFECDAKISERWMREYYLPAFESCIRRGKAESIMSAYNAINGTPCTANPWLLTKVLRDEWGFNGYVVSDCGAVGNVWEDHHYVKRTETAAALCLRAGLDLECGDNFYIEPLKEAYRLGMVNDEDIDRAARRVLTARMKLGFFDTGENNPYTKLSPAIVGSEPHRQLALEAAREAIVLLKNKNGMLPINKKKAKKIAVVGINAASCEFGDYSGVPVTKPVSILQGIREAAGNDAEILYAPWKSANDNSDIIAPEYFPDGLKAEYYSNDNLEGKPATRKEEWINFEPSNQAPDPFIPAPKVSIRWTGTLQAPVSGEYVLSLKSDESALLRIDGKTVIDAWQGHDARIDSARIRLEAGKRYQIAMEYRNSSNYAVARLSWQMPEEALRTRKAISAETEEVARKSDVVVAVMGINKSIEREGKDRDDISLPTDQQAFIKELYKINPNVVLVLVAGSSLAIDWENQNLPAIVNAWYPGQEGGTAVAEVLFGKYNPAGRLPLTYYKSLDDLPAFDDYDLSNRTYKFFKGDVIYPFGFGLSYSKFKYSDLKIKENENGIDVSFTIKNEGRYDGDEVAQVYVRLPEYEGVAPKKELRGFKRVNLKKGEQKKVTVNLRREDLRYWSESQGKFIYPAGIPAIMVGASSEDIRLTN